MKNLPEGGGGIAGYYRGLIYNVDAVKDYLKAARAFIEKIG